MKVAARKVAGMEMNRAATLVLRGWVSSTMLMDIKEAVEVGKREGGRERWGGEWGGSGA